MFPNLTHTLFTWQQKQTSELCVYTILIVSIRQESFIMLVVALEAYWLGKKHGIYIYTLYTVQNIFFTINKTLYCIVMRTERKITQSFFLNQTTYFWDVSQHYNILDFLELEFLTVYHRTYHKNNEHPYPCILTYLIYYTYIQYLYIFDSVSYLLYEWAEEYL